MRDRRFDRPYVLQVPGDINPYELQNGEADNLMHAFYEEYNEKLQNRELKVTSKEILSKKTNEEYDRLTQEFMEVIKENYLTRTFEPIENIFKKLHIPNKQQSELVQCLVNIKCITIKNLRNYSRISKDFPIITEEWMNRLRIPKSKQINPEYFKHTYYCERVHAWLESKGLQPVREYQITEGRIDVFVETIKSIEISKTLSIKGRLACEISTTPSAQDINPNIRKCLGELENQLDLILIICEKAEDRDKAKQRVEQSKAFTEDQLSKVKYITMDKFLEKIT